MQFGEPAPDRPVTADLVTSQSNPVLKRARKLRQRKYREKEGAFFVEGIQPVTQAIRHDGGIQMIVLAPAILGDHPVTQLVEERRSRNTTVVEVDRDAFASISNRDDPSGLAAIVSSAPAAIEDLEIDGDSLFVVLDEVGNPGNLGAIIRTLDAVRGGGVILIGSATDPYHPTAVKASMGTIFAVPVCRLPDFGALHEWAARAGVSLVTTSSKAEKEHWSTEIPLPAALVFGSEGRGLPQDVLESGDVVLRIPIKGSASSLNLAIAASVMIYEVERRRRHPETP
ncbi:MAG TPA: RNA methyltransferase [Actinomycetota bacterium]|nr:RNA methyltransferase [Actinomycetota bacterium]